ncbi:hypothetical protein SAMN02799630_01456 [Paenibacillus sp. UNCCL117]|uniref:hypothetical protein n=1 Tax=unclassified Paenibacillus TaxID=185978 RepID=UPI00087EA7CC|nr:MULTISPECIES: hypothetical protein [unclassified Paenibacillus]SDC77712.1 hypothetical protein SAMN04488602_103435 [Paenibacillus sp. cl123]SFW25882.1 hypothetical protein SAMN02799630_01456 [Paenibacillus sp. UNCCL117]
MRNFMVGIVVGAGIASFGTVYANEIVSIIGKEVQGTFPITVNGQRLATDAAIIDGTSYISVRAAGEALDLEVSFDPKTGIDMKNTIEAMETIRVILPNQKTDAPVRSLEELERLIGDEKRSIESQMEIMEFIKRSLNDLYADKKSVEQAINIYKDQIAAAEQRLADLERRKTELEGGK